MEPREAMNIFGGFGSRRLRLGLLQAVLSSRFHRAAHTVCNEILADIEVSRHCRSPGFLVLRNRRL
jgi:hypothetical protein